MPVKLVYEFKQAFHDGAIVEMVIWRLPEPLPGSRHPYQSRLFYGYPVRRLIGYDNERGKADHRHFAGREEPYNFVSVGRMIAEFVTEVTARRTA